MLKVGIIIGSTRPGRVGDSVAKWVFDIAQKRRDAEFELVDMQDYNLPLLDEPIPASQKKYSKDHTFKWSEKIQTFDAFVFVTPEYNHGITGALKNALDFLYQEWNNKAAGIVSYGSASGYRAVESLRLILAELQIAAVRAQVSFSLYTDFENFKTFKPDPENVKRVNTMIDQTIAWGTALKQMRDEGSKDTK
ncbi:MAG: NAD(P)H-dependent oxidoreductase [Ignavibacteria bacterium]